MTSIERAGPFARKIEGVAAPPTLPLPIQPPVHAPAPLRLWHLASLDAPTVAVVWCLAFAWTARVALPLWLPTVLALAAWTCYIADRLLDARRELEVDSASRVRTSRASPLRARHLFHWKHRHIFLPICIASAAIAMGLVWHSMPVTAARRNSLLAIAAIAYFSTVHSPWRVSKLGTRLPKELLVATLFTLACALPAWARTSGDRGLLAAPVAIYIALAWLNCVGIETWECGVIGRPSIFSRGLALAAISLAAALLAAVWHHPRLAWLFAMAALSASLLGLLDRLRHRLTPTTLRAAADLALLMPMALWLWP